MNPLHAIFFSLPAQERASFSASLASSQQNFSMLPRIHIEPSQFRTQLHPAFAQGRSDQNQSISLSLFFIYFSSKKFFIFMVNSGRPQEPKHQHQQGLEKRHCLGSSFLASETRRLRHQFDGVTSFVAVGEVGEAGGKSKKGRVFAFCF